MKKTIFIFLISSFILLSSGCTYNRNAPWLSSEIQINDSANGNTIPISP